MRFIFDGQPAPFGLSRGNGFVRLRLPVWIYWGRRYDIINDEFHSGAWNLNMVIRFYKWRVETRFGWSVIGKKRKYGVLPV